MFGFLAEENFGYKSRELGFILSSAAIVFICAQVMLFSRMQRRFGKRAWVAAGDGSASQPEPSPPTARRDCCHRRPRAGGRSRRHPAAGPAWTCLRRHLLPLGRLRPDQPCHAVAPLSVRAVSLCAALVATYRASALARQLCASGVAGPRSRVRAGGRRAVPRDHATGAGRPVRLWPGAALHPLRLSRRPLGGRHGRRAPQGGLQPRRRRR